MKLSHLADGLTVVVGLAILGVLGARLLPNPNEGPPPLADVQLDGEVIGVNFAEADRTLLMVLQSDCPFCEQSVPFYRSLPPRPAGLLLVIAAPPGDVGIKAYAEFIKPDGVVWAEPESLPVRGTPTLLLVNSEGVVENAWMGLLDEGRQAQVRAVFSLTDDS